MSILLRRVSVSVLSVIISFTLVHTASEAAVAKKVPAKKSATTISCTIKGNISTNAKKEKIYHMKGCPNYNQTIIDTTKGERMFCSESEAKIAGWRKALNCPK